MGVKQEGFTFFRRRFNYQRLGYNLRYLIHECRIQLRVWKAFYNAIGRYSDKISIQIILFFLLYQSIVEHHLRQSLSSQLCFALTLRAWSSNVVRFYFIDLSNIRCLFVSHYKRRTLSGHALPLRLIVHSPISLVDRPEHYHVFLDLMQ